MRLHHYVRIPLVVLSLALAASCSSDDGGGGSPEDIVRIELSSESLMLAGAGDEQLVTARALDLSGNEVDADLEWTVDDATLVEVSADGRFVASGTIGSTAARASVGAVTSADLLVYVSEPVSGALLYTDDQVVGEPELLTVVPPLVGAQIRVVLRDVDPPTVGTVVLPRGDTPAAGVVVTATTAGNTVELTLEVRPLTELFEELDVSSSGPVTEPPDSTPGMATEALEFNLGPFECEGTSTEIESPMLTRDLTRDLSREVSYKISGRTLDSATVKLSGSLGLTVGASISVPDTLSGNITCDLDLATLSFPLPGPLGLALKGTVPIGVGFEVSGELSGTEVNIGVTGSFGATVEVGFTYDRTAGVQPLQTIDVTRMVDTTFEVPDPSMLQLNLDGSVYAYANLEAAPRIGSATFQFLETTAGIAQLAELQLPRAQVADPMERSFYETNAFWKLEAGSDIRSLLDKIGIADSLTLEVEGHTTLARSPTGTVTANPAAVEPDEPVTLEVSFAADSTHYFGVYNIGSITFYEVHADGSLTEIETVSVREELSTISTTWTPTDSDLGRTTIAAFVNTTLLPPIPLEALEDSRVAVDVGGPPPPGGIVFSGTAIGARSSETNIYTMNEDGTNLQQVTMGGMLRQAHLTPIWSPDGSRIAYFEELGRRIALIDPDGSNLRRLNRDFVPNTQDGATYSGHIKFDWSPDSSSIVHVREAVPGISGIVPEVRVVDADDTGLITVFTGSYDDDRIFAPRYSPDGTTIMFCRQEVRFPGSVETYTVRPDGTGLRDITASLDSTMMEAFCGMTWSPSGQILGSGSYMGRTGFFLMSASGGTPTLVRESFFGTPMANPASWPQFSPDGTKLVSRASMGGNHIEVLTLGSGAVSRFAYGAITGGFAWAGNDHVLVAYEPGGTGGVLDVIRFSADGTSMTDLTANGDVVGPMMGIAERLSTGRRAWVAAP